MTDHADIDALVERAARRDPDAFRALYEEFAPRLYRFTLFRLRDAADAEDLVQRVFVKMIEALPRYEQRGLPFGAWVFRLARNAIIDFERTRRPHETLDFVAELTGAGPGPDELAELSVQREELLRAIATLTPEQQEVVTLRFFGGLAPAEIGGLMGKREGSVRALQFRAIETLRRQMTAGVPESLDGRSNSTRKGVDSSTGAAAVGPAGTAATPPYVKSDAKDGNETADGGAESGDALAETRAHDELARGDAVLREADVPEADLRDAEPGLGELAPLAIQRLGLEGLES